MDFGSVFGEANALLEGLKGTLLITGASLVVGLSLGLAVALLRLSGTRLLRGPAIALIEFFRNTPPLVQLIWVFFALPIVTGVNLSIFQAAVIGLGLNATAFMAEIFRAGIEGIPRSQWDAAYVLELRRSQTLRFIVLPQAIRLVLPALAAQSIRVLKASPIVAVISMEDLLYYGNLVATATLRPTETFLVVGAIYAILVYPASVGVGKLETGMRRGLTA